jgi:hypothetical protein
MLGEGTRHPDQPARALHGGFCVCGRLPSALVIAFSACMKLGPPEVSLFFGR